ncbi:MAG: UDP-N-acetylenolpyruvoylglucosamine reductase [Chlamydiae bacterium]|nr:UDP-N-acetylenolpyruvoylglucosamine reductase [Chlamydiota bacterium]
MLPFPYEKEKPLSELTTLRIGGPAKYYAEAQTIEEVEQMVAYCHQARIPFLLLGKGSNSLFDDRGYPGLVILNKITTFEQIDDRFIVGGGYNFSRLGLQTAKAGWNGLEFAAAIPATVGGAIYMNAGANGQETADVLVCVTFVNERGQREIFKRDELEFGYRSSSFQKRRGAIVQGEFKLTRSKEAKQAQKKIVDYRLKTQPYGESSAGCAFRNPHEEAAGRLIEACGLKGVVIGGAQVSPKHANFIINRGHATAADVLALIAEIKERVYLEKKIMLEEEIRFISYEQPQL